MYYDKEVKGGRMMWTVWLESFAVGEERPADAKDRSKIAISISNNFHKKGRATFVTASVKGDPFKITVRRVK